MYTWVSRASAARRFAVYTALSASEPRRERCVTPPSHQRVAWIFNPRCVGNVRQQASHLCPSSIASTSASVVELTRVLRWIYTTLLLASDINIAAPVREPVESVVTLAVAVSASASASAASSAYSNFDMMVVLPPMPTATPGFWRSCIRKIRSSPAIKAMGEKMSPWSTPLAMSNGSESVIVPSGCLMRTIPVDAANIACTMRRTLAPTPAYARASSSNIWLSLSNAAL